MPRSDQEKLFARTRGWIALAAEEGGERLLGCSICGRSWDIGELPAHADDLWPLDRPIHDLPCRHDGVPFPLAVLRKPETYGWPAGGPYGV